ncbi:hypothetical protein INR49_022448 [Caranx melampygus]|nr:hypothetical protein INR49_022448 [Caranx melampygus]
MPSYLPSLFTRGATIREPKKPPSGYMDTDRDQSRVKKFSSIDSGIICRSSGAVLFSLCGCVLSRQQPVTGVLRARHLRSTLGATAAERGAQACAERLSEQYKHDAVGCSLRGVANTLWRPNRGAADVEDREGDISQELPDLPGQQHPQDPVRQSGVCYLPDEVENELQAVGHSLAGPHDEDVEVNGDGHGPEEGAGVGESGHGSLDDAVHRVGLENSPDSVSVGDGGEPVRHREVNQQSPRGRPQVGPRDVGEDDEGRAHEGERAREQNDHLFGQVNNVEIYKKKKSSGRIFLPLLSPPESLALRTHTPLMPSFVVVVVRRQWPHMGSPLGEGQADGKQ